MSDNGEGKEKKCPFMLECDECRLSIEMMNYANQQKFSMCAIVTTATMLSEINMKTPMPQQPIQVKDLNLYRG